MTTIRAITREPARALMIEGRRVTGVRATDSNGGAAIDIAARLTVYAAGGAMVALVM